MKHLRSPSRLLLPMVITCTAFLLSLTGCNPNAKAVYDQIKPEFYKDYPEARDVRVYPEMHGSVGGVLGYALYLKFVYKTSDSDQDRQVIWFCSDDKDKGWIVKDKNPSR